jgi:hypothetical protein
MLMATDVQMNILFVHPWPFILLVMGNAVAKILAAHARKRLYPVPFASLKLSDTRIFRRKTPELNVLIINGIKGD